MDVLYNLCWLHFGVYRQMLGKEIWDDPSNFEERYAAMQRIGLAPPLLYTGTLEQGQKMPNRGQCLLKLEVCAVTRPLSRVAGRGLLTLRYVS